MRTYLNKPMEALAADLSAGLRRLRKAYVDSAETLLQLIDPGQDYPYEFVVYRLTGFRPARTQSPSPTMSGKTLRHDLLRLMLDVCDSFDLRAEDYEEPVYDMQSLAQRLRVSTKTVARWRRQGLPARRLVFADGRRRVALLRSSLRWFIRSRRRQVMRSVRFSQIAQAERGDIVRRARRMARFSQCSISVIARRLAARTGRSPEAIRYTLRRHDLENPHRAIFPQTAPPLDEQAKSVIYRCFLRGVPAPALAQTYGRTRGSIYRVINEMRARQLLQRPIGYVYNPQFDLPNADEVILQPLAQPQPESAERTEQPPADLPEHLLSLYEVPLLTAGREHDLFRCYNYLKHKADRLRRQIDLNHVRTGLLKQIEKFLLQANAVKNEIVRANLRLVVSIARRHVGGPQTLQELISDGNVTLLRAVEKFDYSRGNRFSTYASWAIMRNFARSVPRERYQLDRLASGTNEALDVIGALRQYDGQAVNLPEMRESVDALLAQLSPRERAILIGHYGLDESRPAQTFESLGRDLGLSKERVRQIESQALRKLRRLASPH